MKRLTDTEKWKDPWYRKLSLLNKVFWAYICDNCDNAGVWKPDFELASFCIGSELDPKALVEVFKDRITVLDPGRWHIKKFVAFQFGCLSPISRPHQSVMELL